MYHTQKTSFPAVQHLVFLGLAALCLFPFISPSSALLLGIITAQCIKHPFEQHTKVATTWLLQASVVGLGFGMNALDALEVGKEGIMLTISSIVATLSIGLLLGKLFKVEKITGFLITAGTAICGGSAIAALSPVIKAKENQTTVALGVIFILNAIALFIFPAIGHFLDLTQKEFGLWCAIAIHDTSSVVGAAAKYGDQALQVATTVKLGRALWIIPLTLFSAFCFQNKEAKIKFPYFIGLFILAILANTYIPFFPPISHFLVSMAESSLTLTLFLIGSSLSFRLLKTVGLAPLFQGSILWILISVTTLWIILLL